MLTIEVQTRTFGHQQSQETGTVLLKLLEEQMTIAELIRRSVEERLREEAMTQNRQVTAHDLQTQVEKALRAFEANSYLLLVDGRRMKTLDEELVFVPSTKVMFLRLTLLAGG